MILPIFILMASVAGGALLGYFFKQYTRHGVRMLITFSGAYLLGIGIFHMLPHMFHSGTDGHTLGLFIVAGFLLQLILEWFSKGIEHGHGHGDMFAGRILPWGLLISLLVHAFLESLPLGMQQQEPLLWGIAVHKLPISLILWVMLWQHTRSYRKAALALLGFALIAPLGVLTGLYFPDLIKYEAQILALVFGIFLHVSTTILFESSQSHRVNFLKFAIALGAFLLAYWSTVAEHG